MIERKQMESWLQHIARHDPLTDLPNRELFHDRLQTSLNWADNATRPRWPCSTSISTNSSR